MSETTIAFWSMIGTWVAGIGTISAVVTSLWLARKQEKIDLNVIAGHRQIVTVGSEDTPDYCMIKVTNRGVRPAKITNVGWEYGSLTKKNHLIQLFGFPESDDIPKVLNEGEDACFLIPFSNSLSEGTWITTFPKQLTPSGIKSLKVCVYTSVGQAFKVKVEKGLKEQFLDSLASEKQS
ncbi:hypothetical protein [Vibrio alginolyticus]|uniref:hypothetical protein n=1 Tax=Vibrio alginolyticus TaxID=663 RepID=UPI00215C11CD|nr:hypothetical protein [Vibrio alginolyticus]MCR9527509.1 hypothetical protein [Vibrio alginolyticus]